MNPRAKSTRRQQTSGPVASNRLPSVNIEGFLARTSEDHAILTCLAGETIFSQAEMADTIFFLLKGTINLTVASQRGRVAVISLLEPGTFVGESCLSGQALRRTTARVVEACQVIRIPKATMLRLLRTQPTFAELFVTHLLSRAARMEGELLGHLFDSCEKRLARALLIMAEFGKNGKRPRTTLRRTTQASLAEMVGATRSEVSFFMKQFKDRGYIDDTGALHVHNSLLAVVLQD